MSEVDEGKPHLRSLFDGEIYSLEGEMIVGRQAECNIVLDRELGASRKHARFKVDGQNVFVTDLGSLNGTLVNGKEIESEAQLSNGDILIFDVNEYEVVIPTHTSEPAIDPDRTVFVKRDKKRKQEPSEPPLGSTDERNEVEVAVPKDSEVAQKIAPEPSTQHSPEPAAEPEAAASEPAASEPAASEPAASEPAASEPAAPEPAASEPAAPEAAASEPAAPEPAAPEAAAPEPAAPEPAAPEPAAPEPAAPEAAEAVRRPGSWGISANVNNTDGTVLAAGVVAVNMEAAQVDFSSISEPTIIVQSGENADTLLPLVGEQTEWSIGSSVDRDLRITQSGVSGNHAAIVREGSKWKVVDQMSINGTFVNGTRVNVRFIDNEDLLRFGPVECRFIVPVGFSGGRKSSKNAGTGISLWKIAVPIAILLILGGGYYAYSTGMFSPAAESATTVTQ